MDEKNGSVKKNDKMLTVSVSGIDYEFVELEVLMGLGIYHQVIDAIAGDFKDFESAIATIKKLKIPDFFELVAMFLAGAKVGDDRCNDLGQCETFRKDPAAVYPALAMAIASNYPGAFPLVLTGPSDTRESPSQK
jgi:hypothetical protein